MLYVYTVPAGISALPGTDAEADDQTAASSGERSASRPVVQFRKRQDICNIHVHSCFS